MRGSDYLEKLSKGSVEINILKGVGTAGEAMGKFIGNIPVVNNGPVDEFLQDRGAQLRSNAFEIERDVLFTFAALSNPGIGVFLDKMCDLIQIYNYTSSICFDDERIYLVA